MRPRLQFFLWGYKCGRNISAATIKVRLQFQIFIKLLWFFLKIYSFTLQSLPYLHILRVLRLQFKCGFYFISYWCRCGCYLSAAAISDFTVPIRFRNKPSSSKNFCFFLHRQRQWQRQCQRQRQDWQRQKLHRQSQRCNINRVRDRNG